MDRLVELRVRLFFEEPCMEETARLHVFLEDTTDAEASAVVIAHYAGAVSEREVVFEQVTVNERRRYTVRAWIDCDGDGQVSKGDRVSTEAYPVLTQGYPAAVEVRLTRV